MVMLAEPLAQAGQCSDELITVDTSSALQKTLHVSTIVVKSGDSKEVKSGDSDKHTLYWLIHTADELHLFNFSIGARIEHGHRQARVSVKTLCFN